MTQALAAFHAAVQMVHASRAFRSRQTFRATFLVIMITAFLSGLCLGQMSVTLSPKTGPPTSETHVSGSGFAPNAEIDIYFDSAYQTFVNASSSGSFSKVSVQVPASAVPGEHWVSAEQVSTDTGAQAPFKVNTNWSTFGFSPSGGRFNPYENVLNTTNVGSLQLKWRYYIGNFGEYQLNSSAAVVDGVVYVGSSSPAGAMYALNATTGKLLWTFPVVGSIGAVLSSPAAVSGKVYFGSIDENVYALGAAGVLVGLYTTQGEVTSSPAVVDGILYVGSNDGNLYALGSKGLTWDWQYATGGPVDSSPAVANGVVYVGSEYGNNPPAPPALTAFNADSTGGFLWEDPPCGSVESSPAVANGSVVYVGDDEGCVTAFEPNIQTAWQVTPTGSPIQSLAESDGVIYAGDTNGFLVALNGLSGTQLWGVNPCQPNCQSFGTEIGYSSPAVANGVVYVGGGANTGNGFVAAVDAATGAVLWNFVFDDLVTASPTVVNGMLYIQALDGYMYALGLPDPPQPQTRPKLSSLHRRQ